MTPQETQEQWLEFQRNLWELQIPAKLGQLGVLEQVSRYKLLSAEERVAVNSVIADEVLSAEKSVRFGALALVREFRIVETRPQLEELYERLRYSHDLGAPFEREKIEDILSTLS